MDNRLDALAQAVRERHPNELPAIIALQAGGWLDPYLQWACDETRPEILENPE